jgi:hypothetical protein
LQKKFKSSRNQQTLIDGSVDKHRNKHLLELGSIALVLAPTQIQAVSTDLGLRMGIKNTSILDGTPKQMIWKYGQVITLDYNLLNVQCNNFIILGCDRFSTSRMHQSETLLIFGSG